MTATVPRQAGRERSRLGRPDFLVIGAQRSGTSSLAAALRRQPDVFIPRMTEAHHFGRVPDDEVGAPAYAEFFRAWDGERLVGEATPEYLYLPTAPRQIHRLVPHVWCITVLRNPVHRAYSAYWHGVRRGVLRGSFEDVLTLEAPKLGAGSMGFFALVDHGRYIGQLRRFERHGFDRSQLHIVVFEELTSRTTEILSEVQTFLGVADDIVELPREKLAQQSILPAPLRPFLAKRWRAPPVRRNMWRFERPLSAPPMAPLTRNRLMDHFRPYNDALAAWLGRDLSLSEGL